MSAERAIDYISNREVANDENLKAGRPRSEESRKAILDAARKLMARMPMADLTIEAIAKRAGVGKTTIYRWWPSKAAVAVEAFVEQPGINHVVARGGSYAYAVSHQIESMIRQLRGLNGRIVAGVVAEGQSDPAVLDMLYDKYLKVRVEALYKLIEEGKAAGEFRANVRTDIVADMILGPLFLRILSGEHGIDPDFADNYAEQAIAILAA